MPAGEAPPSLALAAYDEDEDGEDGLVGVGEFSPTGYDDDEASEAGVIPDVDHVAPAEPSSTLDELMEMGGPDESDDDIIVDVEASPESPQEALAPDSLPLFDPNDPIEDFPAGESQPLGSHVDKASDFEKGGDHVFESRPVARPLNKVNPKSLAYDPMDDGSGNEYEDCPLEMIDNGIVADQPASSASGASSSSSGSTPSDRAAVLRDLLCKMSAMHQSLDAKQDTPTSAAPAKPVKKLFEPVVVMDSLPYGFDADGTLPMDVDSQSLPADVALAIEREPEQVLTRRMQLGATEAEEAEDGEKPKNKGKGKGKGRGGKGRGRGRGRSTGAAEPEIPPAGEASSSTPAASEVKPKRQPKRKAKAAKPDPAIGNGEHVPEPVPKAKAKAKARVKKSRAATDEAVGGEDGVGSDAANAAPAPAPKRRRLRHASAAVEPPAAAVEIPAENPAEGHAGVNAVAAAPEVENGDALPVQEPVEDRAEPVHGPANAELSADGVTKIQAWRGVPQRWRTLTMLFGSMYGEINAKKVPKMAYYTFSMYWKTFRVGLVHKPSKQHVLSFNACGTRQIGLPLAAAMDYVQFTGGDIDDPAHMAAAAFEYRSMLLEMIQVCSELWKLRKAPGDFVA
eukprot:s906_g9.t1